MIKPALVVILGLSVFAVVASGQPRSTRF